MCVTPKSRGNYKIVAKVIYNIFVLADSEGFLMGNYHVKDLKLLIEKQELGQNFDSQSENGDLNPILETSNQNSLDKSSSRIVLGPAEEESNRGIILLTSQNFQDNLPLPILQDNPQKKGPGRPKNNKKGKHKNCSRP